MQKTSKLPLATTRKETRSEYKMFSLAKGKNAFMIYQEKMG